MYHGVGTLAHTRAVGDADPCNAELPEVLVNLPFPFDVEVRRTLVEEENLGPPIERPRQQHSLLLPAGQGATHVTNQAVVGHRHGHDFFVDACHARAVHHPLLVEGGVEETDVVSDGAGKELVLLHHSSNVLSVSSRADDLHWDTVDQHLPTRRFEQSKHDLEQRRLAAARGPCDRDKLPRADGHADTVENEALGLGVAEADISQLDPAPDFPTKHRWLVMAALQGTQRNVGQPLEMQTKDAELQRLLNQQNRFLREMALVAALST